MVEETKNKKMKEEIKTEEKKDAKAPKLEAKVEIKAKDVAVVNGNSQRISTKYSFEVCRMIRHKEIDKAIAELELVVKKKKAVPMHSLEVAHKPGAMAGGKYPVTVAKAFIELLKQLKANASVNQIENPVITMCMANQAPRPYRRAGTRGKRTHIRFEARDKNKLGAKK